jgi:folate-dependent phosphoribosylglycinamide formyltransferase PurN
VTGGGDRETPSDLPASAPSAERRVRVVLLVAEGELAAIVINGLHRAFPDLVVLQERVEDKRTVLRRRARLLGAPQAIGQALCGLLTRATVPLARARIAEVHREAELDTSFNAGVRRIAIDSVNSVACREALAALSPQVVAVYGTRMIGRATLEAITVPLLNYHAGITPKYRGQHPAYWALREGDGDNAGITIHLVDRGVDTGAAIRQARVAFMPRDTINTYQHVQMATALPLFVEAIREALAGRLTPTTVALPSRQWFPPTLWAYVWGSVTRGVW